jgi:hypothetical protein
MKTKELINQAHKIADPGDTLGFKAKDKPRAKEALAIGVEVLC